MNALTALSPRELETLARRRAKSKLGWYTHALVFVCVNGGLALLALAFDKTWAVIPALGWGLGLGIHGLVVLTRSYGQGLFQVLVQRERQRLESLRDPW